MLELTVHSAIGRALNLCFGCLSVVADLDQQWLQLVKMLVDNIPEGLSVWIDKFNQVVEPLLEQIRGLLNVTEDKAEL